MKRFSFKMLAVAAAVCAVCWLGCGGDDNNPADNNGNNSNNSGNNNGSNRDSRLVCNNGEAWLQGTSCESAEMGIVLKSNGDWIELVRDDEDGILRRKERTLKWRTDGGKIILTDERGYELSETFPYEVLSDGGLIVTDSGKRRSHIKCSGVTAGWK